MNRPMEKTFDEWLASQSATYRKRMYAGLARAREAHALSLLRPGADDTNALHHMQIAADYERRAAAIPGDLP